MNVKTKVDSLWARMRESVNMTYRESEIKGLLNTHKGNFNKDDGQCLRDYAENISWSDNMASLLGRESANERRHRAGNLSVPGFSIDTASKLILMNSIAEGSKLTEMPRGTEFLVFRQTAAEARLIGYIARAFITTEWREAVESLDYAKLMEAK